MFFIKRRGLYVPFFYFFLKWSNVVKPRPEPVNNNIPFHTYSLRGISKKMLDTNARHTNRKDIVVITLLDEGLPSTPINIFLIKSIIVFFSLINIQYLCIMENALTLKEITLLKNMIDNHITIQQMSGVNQNEMLNNINEKLSDLMIELYIKNQK